MKKSVYILTVVVMLVLAAGVSSANAQTTTQMSANIPFAFHVGDQSFAAGEYDVRITNPSSDRKVLQLRTKDGSASVMIQMNTVINDSNRDAKLVFNRYGNRYYFAQAWMATETGMQAPRSRGERATAEEVAQIHRAIEMVALNRRR